MYTHIHRHDNVNLITIKAHAKHTLATHSCRKSYKFISRSSYKSIKANRLP